MGNCKSKNAPRDVAHAQVRMSENCAGWELTQQHGNNITASIRAR